MIQTKTTSERLLERYHTYMDRPLTAEPSRRRRTFGSFQRVIGRWLPSDRSARILDIACGEGALLAFLRARGHTHLEGFDISPENVRICHEFGLTFVRQGDAVSLAQIDGCYDVIFAFDILEHLPKQVAAAFLEAVRLRLAPGGYVVIQTPNMGGLLGTYHRYNDLSHEFGLTEHSARALLRVAGFAADRIDLRPVWDATTSLGLVRELYLRILHHAVYLGESRGEVATIPTKNLLIRATNA